MPKLTAQQPTTAQSLGALLKSARDIMRKDKGLNGDLDRLPMLTWIMFLKFLDDLELQREGEVRLTTKKFKPAIELPYRWRDWAAKSDGITGDELLAFINNEETTLPNGKKGAGLFRYLRTLTSSNGDDRREVIATVFRGVQNRMVSGYLLRDVINKIGGIHFTSSGELHTLGALYESMLREMRDAAGDSGEFYTPRPVVRLMVVVTDPRLGETMLDPAGGTGGFIVETFNHLSKQVKTVADRRILQEKSLFGCEPKTLPYLLCQMNLLLHGLDAPQIDPGNALRFKLTDIGERDRVDVILTKPLKRSAKAQRRPAATDSKRNSCSIWSCLFPKKRFNWKSLKQAIAPGRWRILFKVSRQGSVLSRWTRLRKSTVENYKPTLMHPIGEQRRIVSELNALQAEVDALKRLQAESAAEVDTLLPAILDKAFKGEL